MTSRSEWTTLYKRIGHCCGCRESAGNDLPLYRVSPDRYRCLKCFKTETGHYP